MYTTTKEIEDYLKEKRFKPSPDIVIMDYDSLILPSKGIDVMMRIFDRHTRRELRKKKLESILNGTK